MTKKLHDKAYLKMFRIELRKDLTPAEAFLWNYLKNRKFENRKFRRQHSIGNFIVDFYCAEEKLIIELDGEVHLNSNAEEYDTNRTKFLEECGYKVIRFENKMVFDFLPSVLNEKKENFNS